MRILQYKRVKKKEGAHIVPTTLSSASQSLFLISKSPRNSSSSPSEPSAPPTSIISHTSPDSQKSFPNQCMSKKVQSEVLHMEISLYVFEGET